MASQNTHPHLHPGLRGLGNCATLHLRCAAPTPVTGRCVWVMFLSSVFVFPPVSLECGGNRSAGFTKPQSSEFLNTGCRSSGFFIVLSEVNSNRVGRRWVPSARRPGPVLARAATLGWGRRPCCADQVPCVSSASRIRGLRPLPSTALGTGSPLGAQVGAWVCEVT